jgi:hypothetical protein
MVRYNRYQDCITTETQKMLNGIGLKEDEIRFRLANLASNLDFYYGGYAGQVERDKNIALDELKNVEKQLDILSDSRKNIDRASETCQSSYLYDVFLWFSWLNPISTANAQIKIGGYSESEIRGIVIISIFACMGVFFFLSTGALLFSKNAKVVAFAMDSVKTLLGFFIGVAMSFLGVR